MSSIKNIIISKYILINLIPVSKIIKEKGTSLVLGDKPIFWLRILEIS